MKPEMVFIDIETTGLDPVHDVPLEIGLIVTDRWGNEIATWDSIIVEEEDWFKKELEASKKDPFVYPMHTKSGLYHDLAQAKKPKPIATVEDRAITFLLQYFEVGRVPMSGSSIGSLDRPFVKEYMPHLNEFFSYRNIDVSSFKEVCRLVNPYLLKDILAALDKQTPKTHRVLDDARQSIFEYQQYLESFIYVGE